LQSNTKPKVAGTKDEGSSTIAEGLDSAEMENEEW